MAKQIYQPTSPALTEDIKELRAYMYGEFIRLATYLQSTDIVPTYASAPKNPQEGQLAVADGVGWNPPSGAGLYIYLSGWQFIV